MVKLLVLSGFIYAIYLNYSGVCEVSETLGCVDSNETLLIAFGLYLVFGFLFFVKRRFKLWNHKMHYHSKKLKFGFISILFLMVGLAIMVMFGMKFVGV